MFKMTTFRPSLNSETILLLILLALTFLASAFHVTFVYGITFSFTSLFIFVLFRIFGLPLAVITTILTFFFIPDGLLWTSYTFILLAEILFVGIYFHIKKRAKMFFVDAIFWSTIGAVALFLLNKDLLTGDGLYFQITKDILNGLFNVLVADMLLAYFPFYRYVKSISLNKNNVSIHQFLSHITIISIMIPLFLGTLTKTWNTHELITKQSMQAAKNTVSQIEKEILFLTNNSLEINNQESHIKNIVGQFTTADYSIIIMDQNSKVIASTSNVESLSFFHWNRIYDVTRITTNFYQVFPKGQKDVFPIIKSRNGNLLFVHKSKDYPIRICIQFPNSQYQDQIFKEFLIQLKLSMVFAIFTVLFVQIISRLFMNNLKQLTIVTTGLPEKLSRLEHIDWPQGNISELRMLSRNLREMADKLKELFHDSIEMNKVLTSQTTKLKVSEERLHQLAYYDLLTSLPNRLNFLMYARNLLENNPSQTIAIIFLDLNKFKQVNDTLGHDAGDALLQITANRLRKIKDKKSEVFRLSGDEFVIVQKVSNRDEVNQTLKVIHEEFSTPFLINEHKLNISVSVGVSMYPEHGNDLDSLVKCADIAMYVSKEADGKCYYIFDETMRDRFKERLFGEDFSI